MSQSPRQPPDNPQTLPDGFELDLYYNSFMDLRLFEEMKRYVGFGEADAAALRAIRLRLEPEFPDIVDRFYAAIERNEATRRVVAQAGITVERLKATFNEWLRDLFAGDYGADYLARRSRIGRTHVSVGLPQQFMFTGMTVFRLTLIEKVWALRMPDPHAALLAIHKLLDLELAVMNDTYREDLLLRMKELERAQYEQQLNESEHLATIGRLAASLAHEIKNPLAGISGAIQILGAELGEHHAHKEVVVEVMRQIDRLDSAVKDLLVFARPKPPRRRTHNLAEIFERSLMLCREEPTFRTLRVHSDGAGRPVNASVDDNQMSQLFTNLLLNAAHACGPGGEIWCRMNALPGGVRIEIEDHGVGIPAEIRDKIFEPFFTTKARGTGLGLSICKRIVETHGGTILVESEVGRGTRVTVELYD
ncbi:MAG: hypothetical protein HUU22_14090 [Phycisphaerae bacterium]|nr:protoglobin domain-containing protein [Phycisphaerae bacterium]NUQ47150.1 hypothetical protein [Phycisphaerae bacterium]